MVTWIIWELDPNKKVEIDLMLICMVFVFLLYICIIFVIIQYVFVYVYIMKFWLDESIGIIYTI